MRYVYLSRDRYVHPLFKSAMATDMWWRYVWECFLFDAEYKPPLAERKKKLGICVVTLCWIFHLRASFMSECCLRTYHYDTSKNKFSSQHNAKWIQQISLNDDRQILSDRLFLNASVTNTFKPFFHFTVLPVSKTFYHIRQQRRKLKFS